MVYTKKTFKYFVLCLLILTLALGGCTDVKTGCDRHVDDMGDGVCDICFESVFVYVDLYAVSGMAEKPYLNDSLAAYLNDVQKTDRGSLILAAGNMWTDGEWAQRIASMGFDGLTLGEDELETGAEELKSVADNGSLPLTAINVYEKSTDSIASFCVPSIVVEVDGFKMGIIGAVAEADAASDGLYLKTGHELTALVKAEAEELKRDGADMIIYLIHGGYKADSEQVKNVSGGEISSYYDISLSNGYVDLVIEGGTECSYRLRDEHGVYHIQNSHGEDIGVSYAELSFNTVTEKASVRVTRLLTVESDYTPEESDEESAAEGEESDTSLPQEESKNESSEGGTECKKHADANKDTLCDICKGSVIVYFDFYAINDLHGKFANADSHPGVDELTTYLKNARKDNPNSIFLSAGDTYQGSAESNMTKGLILTDWMSNLGFAAMAIGNHEYDWGEEYIQTNSNAAEFPFIAINIYDRDTNELADYCVPSTVVDADGVQIGIIGAIGDCYSSIATDKSEDVYFKVGAQLTALVKAESKRLKEEEGADFIVYVIHDGYGKSNYGSVQKVTSYQLSSYYDTSLSDGYVDLVFEGHTHQGYLLLDEHGVYHLQNRGDNKGGISHAEVAINTVTMEHDVKAELIDHDEYIDLDEDPIVEELLEKYDELISPALEIVGYNSAYRSGSYMKQLVADLYYEFGLSEWGDQYDIVLGGGFMSVRSPYNLYTGDVMYSDLQSLFPFDNRLTLCSVKGKDLKSKFFETQNGDYYIAYGDYGAEVKKNIDSNATYYIIVDTYTAYYAPNRLTVIEEYDYDLFARDLLAEYIENGGLE